MSLKRNILANTTSQLYVTIVGIVIVPLYIKYMGVEAYGLVGFFTMLQAIFSLLDIGFTPTMARETARFRGGMTGVLDYRRLVLSLEGVFLLVAIVGGGGMFAASGFLATDWLQASQLPLSEMLSALRLMVLSVALRWMCSLYRAVITGSEQLVWLGFYNSAIATLRFLGVLAALIFIGATPTVFFGYQFCVAAIELMGLLFKAHRLLPVIPEGEKMSWSWAPLRTVLKFSATIGFISAVWILVTQTDKLLLSKILPLSEYGCFSLAVLVASGVTVISVPISGAIMPRLAKLEAQGDHRGLIRIYRQATQLVAVISGSAAITLAFCAEPLLRVWTGDEALARQAAPILILYALGNGILAISAFPYYLQFAKGDLRLHLFGHVGFIVLLIPSLVWAAKLYGGIGAGSIWLAMNVLYLLTWVPLVHRKFAPGLNLLWYTQDFLFIVLIAAIMGFALNAVWPHYPQRVWQAGAVIGFGLILLLTSASGSSVAREKVRTRLARSRQPNFSV